MFKMDQATTIKYYIVDCVCLMFQKISIDVCNIILPVWKCSERDHSSRNVRPRQWIWQICLVCMWLGVTCQNLQRVFFKSSLKALPRIKVCPFSPKLHLILFIHMVPGATGDRRHGMTKTQSSRKTGHKSTRPRTKVSPAGLTHCNLHSVSHVSVSHIPENR